MPGEGQSRENVHSGQGCHTDRSILKPSSLASVKVNYWKLAVGQRGQVPSPGIFCGAVRVSAVPVSGYIYTWYT